MTRSVISLFLERRAAQVKQLKSGEGAAPRVAGRIRRNDGSSRKRCRVGAPSHQVGRLAQPERRAGDPNVAVKPLRHVEALLQWCRRVSISAAGHQRLAQSALGLSFFRRPTGGMRRFDDRAEGRNRLVELMFALETLGFLKVPRECRLRRELLMGGRRRSAQETERE